MQTVTLWVINYLSLCFLGHGTFDAKTGSHLLADWESLIGRLGWLVTLKLNYNIYPKALYWV